jgi:hypothetical protein
MLVHPRNKCAVTPVAVRGALGARLGSTRQRLSFRMVDSQIPWCLASGTKADREENMDADFPNYPLFVNLKDDDPALFPSVQEARRTLPHFLSAASKRPFSSALYLVKVPFFDRSATGDQALVRTSETGSNEPSRPICHLWLKVTSLFDNLVFYSVCEAPPELHL